MSKGKLVRLGKAIKMECIRRDMSIQEASEYFGMKSPIYLAHIMYGRRKSTGKYEAVIAEFLGLDNLDNFRKRSA